MAIIEPAQPPAGSRRLYRLRSPATLEPAGEFEVATADDVQSAVESARKAQPGWAELEFDEPPRNMHRALRPQVERQDEVVGVVLARPARPGPRRSPRRSSPAAIR
jgi:acyl-CoA reductase-like NAD-dependent aldehyde dehydrogenase